VIDSSKPFFLQALDALKRGDRRGAASLISRQLREGNTSLKNLPSVFQLAGHIGEIELAIEAMHRTVVPGSVDSLIGYWAVLAIYGRSAEALADLESQPETVKEHASTLHFRGTVATQFGRFEEAQEFFRRALAKAPGMGPSWLSLAMIKAFRPDDPDIAAMERLERSPGGRPEARAVLNYALGKAYEDCGDVDRAFAYYSAGGSLHKQRGQFDNVQFGRAADEVIRDHTPDNLARLARSGFKGNRSLFVTGLPRSGTTLTEQILRGHSAVADGAELNVFATALIPTLGIGLNNVMAYEERSDHSDPWGEIGRDYAHFIDMRFQSPGLVVDKSLGQSILTGLMLHALPDARIAWLRRSPDDVALSCFRTYFSVGLPWTCSLTDIAEYMRTEDRLFEHWRSIFPERILTVPYEELVRSPGPWAQKLQQHFGLPIEAGIENRSRADRAIGTASVSQARKSITTSRIGQANAFERHLKPFRDLYYR
jgi:tetratricopeptide (TPR) repeat protein